MLREMSVLPMEHIEYTDRRKTKEVCRNFTTPSRNGTSVVNLDIENTPTRQVFLFPSSLYVDPAMDQQTFKHVTFTQVVASPASEPGKVVTFCWAN